MYVLLHSIRPGPAPAGLAAPPRRPPAGERPEVQFAAASPAGRHYLPPMAAALPPPVRGLWFEDFAVGDRHPTPARTVTEADVSAFASLSGDQNPIHTDEAFARRTPFRRRVAHGLLVQSIVSGLAHRTAIFEGTIVAIAEMLVRFEAPVFFGDTVRAELEVVERDPQPGARRGWVRFEVRVWNQDGRAVSSGEWRTLLLRRREP